MMVFDSSALLAVVRGEKPGGELVQGLIDDSDVPMFVHSANLCEVFPQVWRTDVENGGDGSTFANTTIRNFLRSGLIERSDLDATFWCDAAELIAGRRLSDASLALGDALGVALSRRLDAQFVGPTAPKSNRFERRAS